MDLAGTDLAEAADLVPIPPADLAEAADLDASSACGHRRQRCTDVRAPLGGGGGEDAPQG